MSTILDLALQAGAVNLRLLDGTQELTFTGGQLDVFAELIRNKWTTADTAHIQDIYDALHEGKIGSHWLWVAIEQIAAGDDEEAVMRQFGYVAAEIGKGEGA